MWYVVIAFVILFLSLLIGGISRKESNMKLITIPGRILCTGVLLLLVIPVCIGSAIYMVYAEGSEIWRRTDRETWEMLGPR